MIRILSSFAIIVAAAAVIVGGTYAWQLQTESITGITYSAGSADLKIDEDPAPGNAEWVDGFDAAFASQNGLEPGDNGQQVIDLWNKDEDSGTLSVRIKAVANDENDLLTPESEAGDNTPNVGELDENLRIKISFDPENDGTFEAVAYDYTLAQYNNNPNLLNLGDINNVNGIASVKLEWEIPSNAGNEIMTDSVGIEVEFGLE